MEIEYKVMISESDFIKLDDALKDKPYTLYLQTNYYYDTIKRDLKKNKLSLRIRYIENKNFSGMEYIKAISTTFQTTPSLFKSVQITGSAQPVENNETNTLVLYFNFSYYWETYSGGTNGTELGYMIFEIKNDHIHVKQPFTYLF